MSEKLKYKTKIIADSFKEKYNVPSSLLQAGMTFTIEPSIFIPGKFGARIEDVFVVTENGAEPLNQYPSALEVIN